MTTLVSAQHGSSRAATACGPSKAASWSAAARWDMRLSRLFGGYFRRRQYRDRRRAATTRASARHGSSPAATGCGPSRATSWSAPARSGRPCARLVRRAFRRRQHRDHRWASDLNGAAWVFTRSNGVWTQQGSKLVGSDAVGFARQGTSVALSADGNTAIIGGPEGQLVCRRGVGLHAQQRGVDPAGQQTGRHRRDREGRSRPVRRPFRRRQYRHYRRALATTTFVRRGMDLHAQQRGMDPAGQQAGRHRRGRAGRAGLFPSPCPATAKYRDRRRVLRQFVSRRGLGLHRAEAAQAQHPRLQRRP